MKKNSELKMIRLDPLLKPYENRINRRMEQLAQTENRILGKYADLSSFANGYMYYGFHRTESGWVYREWAPGADEMHLIGDFNGWDRLSHPMTRVSPNGVWEISLTGHDALRHGQRVKVQVTRGGEHFDRIPLYIRKVIQDGPNFSFNGQIWEPDVPFRWTDNGYRKRAIPAPVIYEAHVGMAGENGGICSYDEFTANVLPRIKKDGYNTVQLMAVMQHPYYASFGYQVSNFFAPSMWFGEPEGLKNLINTAHEMGLFVLLDIVHSHAADSSQDGIALFDGTDTQFFAEGEAGHHPAWGTRLFNYGSHDVMHFLLSNVKYWLEEFHFDGFRFDGVTSMLYKNHGLGMQFTDYGQYFSDNTDDDAIVYLQLATELIHTVNPKAIAIAEDMSGMPGMCLPTRYGGMGFDYRLGMGVPDYWIKTIKENNWNLFEMWHELTTRRPQEKVIGYSECHDQALVGDKTIIFRLADAAMYTDMDNVCHTPAIDRAMALSKLIKFITFVLAGDGYLNFMGNEFGHPEWIDFPREGNGFSGHYARRQWSLAENGYLKYKKLGAFDSDMLLFARKYRTLSKKEASSLWIDQDRLVTAFEKGGLLFVFSFHPTLEARDFFVPVPGREKYKLVFTSLREAYADREGFPDGFTVSASELPDGRSGFTLNVPPLSCAVFAPEA